MFNIKNIIQPLLIVGLVTTPVITQAKNLQPQFHHSQKCTINPEASATTHLELNVTLEATVSLPHKPFNAHDRSTYNYSFNTIIFDKAGADHHLQVYFARETYTLWGVYFILDREEKLASGHLYFTANGILEKTIGLDAIHWSAIAPDDFELSMAKSTMFYLPFRIVELNQNGNDLYVCE